MNLKNKRILITGASSMIGRGVYSQLCRKGANVYGLSYNTFHQDFLQYDLRDKTQCEIAFEEEPTDYVVHLAGTNGGLPMNLAQPATIFEETSRMGLNVLDCCVKYNVKKVLSVLSSCAYPPTNRKDGLIQEGTLNDGPPHESVACHGHAKRLLYNYSRFLNKEKGLNAVCVVLQNCFGPHFKLGEKGKVVENLIEKFVYAKANNEPFVKCLGTGNVRRSFIFSEDAAKLIIQSLEDFDDINTPLNIGYPGDMTIKQLALFIRDIVQYNGEIEWDWQAKDGQTRKLLDVSRMEQIFNPEFTKFEKALEKNIRWYVLDVYNGPNKEKLIEEICN